MESVNPNSVIKNALNLLKVYPPDLMELEITFKNNIEYVIYSSESGYTISERTNRRLNDKTPLTDLNQRLKNKIITYITLHNTDEQAENWTIVLYNCNGENCYSEKQLNILKTQSATKIQRKFLEHNYRPSGGAGAIRHAEQAKARGSYSFGKEKCNSDINYLSKR